MADFGPVICATFLVILTLLFFPSSSRSNFKEEKQDAVALSYISFKSKYKKNRALGDKIIVLFLSLGQVNGHVLIVCIRQCWQMPIRESILPIC